jgi:ADP-ribose pyrophosphatase
MSVDLRETKVKSTYYYKGKVINMKVDDVRLPDGSLAKREEIEHPGGCSIVALTAENEVYFVRQFRYAYDEVILEIPAGKLEAGEDPYEAMKRELREETGCLADEFVYLGTAYPTPGYTNELLRIWACRVSGSTQQDLDPDEFLEVEKIPLEQALKMVMDNQISDAKTQIGILKAALLVREGKL